MDKKGVVITVLLHDQICEFAVISQTEQRDFPANGIYIRICGSGSEESELFVILLVRLN